MEREANQAHSFAEAEQWDRQQQWAMTPDERSKWNRTGGAASGQAGGGASEGPR